MKKHYQLLRNCCNTIPKRMHPELHLSKKEKRSALTALLFLFFGLTHGNAQVALTATSGTSTGNYTTLKGAFDAINAGTHKGDIIINIESNTNEGTTPATLNSSGAGSSGYTSVLIQPTADGVSINGNPAQGFGVIQLKGADNVTINGDNPLTSGINRNLTVNNTAANTVTYTSVIRIANTTTTTTVGASSNNITIKNINVNGNAAALNDAAVTSTTSAGNTTFGILVGTNGGTTATDAPTAMTSVTGSAVSGTTVNDFLVDNCQINSCARGIAFMGAAATVSNGINLTNNIIGDQESSLTGIPPFTTPVTTVYTKGIYVQGTTSYTITGNKIRNIVSYVATTLNGIEIASTGAGAGAGIISNNTINGIVNNNNSAAIGVAHSGTTWASTNMEQNTVTNIQTAGNASATGISIISAPATGAIIHRNQVSKIYARSLEGWAATGINQAGTNSITIQNNMIWDLNAVGDNTIFGSQYAVRGIRLTAGTNHRIYHNTVSLSGALLSGGTGEDVTAAFTITTATITGVDVKNNIFSNTMTGANAKHACIQLHYTATNSLNLTLNNNAYYGTILGLTSGTTDSHVTEYAISDFKSNTTAQSSNWRNFSSTLLTSDTDNDNASLAFISNAPFLGINDLHITPTSGELKGKGVATTALIDIDGEARDSVNPDIGADEYTLIEGIDLGALAIASPTANGCRSANETVIVTIKNYGSSVLNLNQNPVTVTTTISGAANQVMSGMVNSGTLAPGASVNVNMTTTLDMTALGTYIFNSSTSISGTDVNSANDALVTVNIKNATLGGTYTVGTGGDFSTLTEAKNAFNNANCFSGNVIFNLTDTTYPSETFPIDFNANITQGSNTLTIKPAEGVTATISGSSATSVIKLNGADYIIIDGSNNGSDSRNLTIENTNAAAQTAAVWLSSLGAGKGATNNTIKNCRIKTGSNTLTTYGIHISSLIISTTSSGHDNNNNTIHNNAISKANFGIYAIGINTTNEINGLTISKNSIGSNDPAEYVLQYGLYMMAANAPVITSNEVYNMIYDGNKYGLWFGTTVHDAIISKNRIYNLGQLGTSATHYCMGIYFSSATGTSNNEISNNIIYKLDQYGSTSNFYYSGIRLVGGSNFKLYFNTISLTGAFGSTTAGVFASCLHVSTASTAMDIRNNVFYNARTGNSPKAYTLNTVTSTTYSNSNNNSYFSAGTALGMVNGTERVLLSDIQTGTGMDTNSISTFPNLISEVNLTPDSGSPLQGAGVTIAGITTDIVEVTRNNPPTIGAYEVSAPLTPTITGFTPSALCEQGGQTITITGTNLNNVTVVSFNGLAGPDTLSGTITGQTATTITVVTPANIIGGNITVVNPAGSATSAMVYTTAPTPTIGVTSDVTICSGSTGTTLTASGGFTYTWSPATGLSTTTGESVVANPITTTTYTVTGTSTAGCTATASVTVTVNETPAPQATTTQSFCDSATVAELTATGTNLKWYTAITGGTALNANENLISGTYYVSQTVNNCESIRTAVTVTVTTSVAPIATAQSFCNSATVAELTATGTNLKWYTAATGGTTLNANENLSTATYYVSQTINGCESTRTAVSVTVNVTAAPTANAQTFCNSATVADLTATGTAIKWYADAIGGTALVSTTALSTGTVYASQTINGCEGPRVAVSVTVNVTPAPTANAQTFCNSATVADLTATGTAIQWYAAASGGTALVSTTTLATGTYYASQTINGCEGPRVAVSITVNVITAPTANAQTFCNSATVANLTATGTAIQWYAAASGGTALVSTTTLATGTYYASQIINGCEGPRVAVSVTVNVTAAPTANAQTFCNSATVADLTATGTAIQWYATASGGTSLISTTALATGTYYASQTVNGCEGPRVAVSVTVNVIAAPTGSATQTFNEGQTLADVVATGSNIVWYASTANAAAGINPLPLSTLLVNGTTYYATQTVAGCTSLTSLAITVTVVLDRNDFNSVKFSYYPNPVIENVTVSYSNIISSVEVYNLLGQRVLTTKPNTTSTEINMSNLPAGTYMLHVTSEGKVGTVKVVKK